jgi:hypothetical protein
MNANDRGFCDRVDVNFKQPGANYFVPRRSPTLTLFCVKGR